MATRFLKISSYDSKIFIILNFSFLFSIEAKSDAKYQSIRRAFATILKEEGITAFWKGHMAAQYLSAMYMTFQFYGVDLFTRKLYSTFPSLNESPVNRTVIVSLGKYCSVHKHTYILFLIIYVFVYLSFPQILLLNTLDTRSNVRFSNGVPVAQ